MPPPPAPSSAPNTAKKVYERPKQVATQIASTDDNETKEKDFVTLLVIDYSYNWYELMKKQKTSDGKRIVVEQTEWGLIHLVARNTPSDGCVLHLKASEHPFPFSSQKQDRVVVPDFALIRNFPTSLHDSSFQNILLGLMFAGVESVNSLHSIFMGMHRPIQVGEMVKVQERIKKLNRMKGAPQSHDMEVVSMHYYFNAKSDKTADDAIDKVCPAPTLPAVVKVATAHAGYGKMRVQNKEDQDDLKSILVMKDDYYTMEPLLDVDYEFRIQKIGKHYRGFKRNSDSWWKGNWGNLVFEDYKLEPHHVMWVEECSEMFNGLDITALDVLRLKDGREVILEMNDTACGLMYEHEAEDNGHIRDLVLQRINEKYSI